MLTDIEIIYRACTRCGEILELNENNFYKDKRRKTGWFPQCKKCKLLYQKEYQNNHKEEQSKRRSEWRLKNIEREANYHRDWATINKDKEKEYVKKFFENNPSKLKEYAEKRKLKNHKISKWQWESCKAYFGDSCAYCGLNIKDHMVQYGENLRKMDFHKEHIKENGENDISNCVPSCRDCNSKKWKHEFNEWYNESNPIFSEDRFLKIIKWIKEDYKLFTC